MRIALIIPTLDRSGAEKQLSLLAAHLPRDQFQPHVIALDRGGAYEAELSAAGIPVTVIGKHGKVDPKSWNRLRKTLKDLDPAVVHSWLFAAHAYAGTAKPGGAKWVQSLRCVDSWMAAWQKAVLRGLQGRVDRFVANGHDVARWYTDQGVPPDRVDVVPNAIEPPTEADGSAVREELGLNPEHKLVVSIGRLAPQKRFKDLIWALQLLRQAESRTRMLIVGDGPERAELERHAVKLECRDWITLAGHRSDTAACLAAADVFWLGSDFEGQSNSLMEAMAAGVPCVATSIEPNRELIEHGREGFLVNVGDSAGFAQFSVRLFEDEQLASQVGHAATQRMTTNHSVTAMVEAYAAIYAAL